MISIDLVGTLLKYFKVGKATLDANAVNTNQVITIPEKTGTLALTSDFQTTFITTFSSDFTINWTNGDGTEVILTSNCSLQFTGTRFKVILILTQDINGGHTISWGNNITFNAGLPVININTSPNGRTILAFIYNSTTGKYDVVANSNE